MDINKDGIIVTHLCGGHCRNSLSPKPLFLECYELKSSGEMVLKGDDGNGITIPFCPFCGKESKAHAALIEQDVVRMVEHAVQESS